MFIKFSFFRIFRSRESEKIKVNKKYINKKTKRDFKRLIK